MSSVAKRDELLSLLTPKQRLFCEEYFISKNQGSAYSKAYGQENLQQATKSAYKLLTYNENVCNYLAYEQSIVARKFALSKGDLISLHRKIVDTYEQVLLLLAKTSPLTQIERERLTFCQNTVKAADYRASLREIGLLQGEYVERIDVQHLTKTIRILTGEEDATTLIEGETYISLPLSEQDTPKQIPDEDLNNSPQNNNFSDFNNFSENEGEIKNE